jgi:hypothetical protein
LRNGVSRRALGAPGLPYQRRATPRSPKLLQVFRNQVFYQNQIVPLVAQLAVFLVDAYFFPAGVSA